MNVKTLAISFGMEEGELLELINLFVETSLSDLNRIQSAADERDAQRLARAAHSIKGAAANLRLTEIFEMAKSIEANGRENKLEGVREMAEAIKENLEGLTESLSRAKEEFSSGR